MFFVRHRNAGWRCHSRQLSVRSFFSHLNASFDFANGVQILVELASVIRRQPHLQIGDLLHYCIKDAPLLLHARAPCCNTCISHVSEQSLKDDTRVGLTWHRRRPIGPRVIQIGTAEAPVAGRHTIDGVAALQRKLQRRHLSCTPEPLSCRRDLVHRNAKLKSRTSCAFRTRAGQERRRSLRMGRTATRLSTDAVEVGHDHHVVTHRR